MTQALEMTWKPDEIAEDLTAQLRELLAAGAPLEGLAHALEREGVTERAARMAVREMLARENLQLSVENREDASTVYGVDLAMARKWLRREPAKTQQHALQEALERHGLSPEIAHELTQDLLVDCQRTMAREHQRMQRLGLQGMWAGALFTLYFTAVALRGLLDDRLHTGRALMTESEIHWNFFTAAMTLGLTGYSALLWHRHRRQNP